MPNVIPKQYGVVLQWSAPSDVWWLSFKGFNVYRAVSPTVPTVGVGALNSAPLTALSFVDTTVSLGTSYNYVVSTVDKNSVEAVYSIATAAVSILSTAPTNFTATVVTI